MLYMQIIILLSYSYFSLSKCNCESEIYCRGPILEKIQMSGLFADSKQFVDMPTSKSKAVVLRNFAALPDNATNSQLRVFLADNFHRPGFEMRIIIPKDWKSNPKFLHKLNDKLKPFAEAIHSKWKGLTRRFDPKKLCNDCQASSLKLPYPFIVPGGRFREFYYWDSHWILEGLYVSEMCTTAGGMIENMLLMIDEVGFIPNGARIYYMNRSQPPLLNLMIKRYLDECMNTEEEKRQFIKRVLPLLEKEYSFWMRERSAEILFPEKGNLTLNVYRTAHWIPRPESFLEDRAIAALPNFDTELKKQLLYQNIASAAESGWDFSGRWIKGNSSQNGLEEIQTVMLVPTDLNVFMLKNEYLLVEFYKTIGGSTGKIDYYQKQAKLREEAIDTVFKIGDDFKWVDFDLGTMKTANRSEYISDISTIWFMDFDKRTLSEIIKQNQQILYNYPGGIPASQDFTGQQWDFPNVWAPIQQLFIESLIKADKGEFGEFYFQALNISQRFINSVYCGYEMFGQVFEKYHAVNVGYPGGGGEYIVQEGFGWTNGVTLWILNKFEGNLTAPSQCLKIDKDIFVKSSFDGQKRYQEKKTSPKSKSKRFRIIAVDIVFKICLLLRLL